MRSYNFRSDKFRIDPKEDESTNPFCYGKALAEWLGERFSQVGHKPEPVIPEDWGWCLVLRREPFLLWVGCGNETQEMLETVPPEEKATFIPSLQSIRWRCIVQAESPPWKGYFWLRLLRLVNPEPEVVNIERQLLQILKSESRITDLTVEPE